jgi:hypothetical protein
MREAPVEREKLDWQSLDVETLSPDLRAGYFEYRKAQDAANKLRLAFEEGMNAKVELPAHLVLAFGYKFGKISVAIAPAERPRARKTAMSLAELIKRAG